MKVAILHSGLQGFFPRFYRNLYAAIKERGDSVRLFAPNSGVNGRANLPDRVIWGTRINWHFHFYMYKLTGIQDVWSVLSTIDLVIKLKKFSPDVINFHVVNDCNLCFPLLLRFINKRNIPVVWTFHDSRAFTGRCACFEEVKCFKWKTGCQCCNSNNPWMTKSWVDNTRIEWLMRRKWFLSINRLTVVSPSLWLNDYVGNSFFKECCRVVINNGIDTSSFSKKHDKCPKEIRETTTKVVLGVAAVWNKSKGIDTMIWLANNLGTGYLVVIVGNLDTCMLAEKAGNVLCLPPTKDVSELISLYQRADVFVNPTMSDNFPTVNIEALSAGTPVVTYKTGGSAECLTNKCGIAVEKGDRKSLLEAVKDVCMHPDFYTRNNCLERSKSFSLTQFDKYVDLFHDIVIE